MKKRSNNKLENVNRKFGSDTFREYLAERGQCALAHPPGEKFSAAGPSVLPLCSPAAEEGKVVHLFVIKQGKA